MPETEHAAQFAVETLVPTDGEGADLLDILSAYRNWCRHKGVEALPAARVGTALARLFESAGITVDECDGRRIALGVSIKGQSRRKRWAYLQHRESKRSVGMGQRMG